ncbi:retrovirus-related Pol polyprotein from transposon TNT 1-94 [Cucumis melo var. makuwa]|uniref:Retrovirus-related Pol polyprotein from transposon TNT 1-94 n=1 Tax=Cucumis melo var. makuwa TaxID=1194695 RepID=A0A5D3E0P7_CUCMM|nr:retrovirus-related Pol polyprotein from transposon TNT 1-94 [Cucumis melo var. makuwa]TYK29653.1 retrovirus-related Pol polyprotein from transposon TNT 1-94 [Cucumis melo var. makuwa]
MDEEIEAIEQNNTWELIDLPKGHKTIGVKWVYKTKLKENGEVDKYKACLVAKGYKQEFGIDYKEVFAPVARHDTIRLVVSLAVQNSWPIFQLDVKSAFLHGELQEKVFVDQPPGYVKVKDEHKVYRLKKTLYELKQAPRAWFRMANCNPVSMPMEVGLKLVRDLEGRKTLYKKIVGSLMYLTTTIFDIMHALRKILEELYFKQEGATKVYCDNSSAIKLSKNLVLHGRSKHIDVKFHFLRDLTRDGVIELYYCKSEDQIADIMTKPLKLPAFQKLRKLLGVCAINKSLN